ncbi:hypothetical protein Vadar_010455 [Vaccinium darrowii]|uniref:Uncharacterized protein n=1 Tax=Vaccinium darrowii TaxID=229202 RepID=A0ACB7Z350_9ERIC|nr:hypothetical protein Vadar_010455 [Vaccinium darrowii]
MGQWTATELPSVLRINLLLLPMADHRILQSSSSSSTVKYGCSLNGREGKVAVLLRTWEGKVLMAGPNRWDYLQACKCKDSIGLSNACGSFRSAHVENGDIFTVSISGEQPGLDYRWVICMEGWTVLKGSHTGKTILRYLLRKLNNLQQKAQYHLQSSLGNNELHLLKLDAKSYSLFYEENKESYRIVADKKHIAAWHGRASLGAQRSSRQATINVTQKAVPAGLRKLLKIGHAVNPRDQVLLQSLALVEYNYSTANLARALIQRASQVDPRDQPVWIRLDFWIPNYSYKGMKDNAA